MILFVNRVVVLVAADNTVAVENTVVLNTGSPSGTGAF